MHVMCALAPCSGLSPWLNQDQCRQMDLVKEIHLLVAGHENEVHAGGLADGGTEEAVPLERQDIDAAASDDTQIEAAAAIPEQPQRKETRASNRAAARGNQPFLTGSFIRHLAYDRGLSAAC